MLSGLAWRITNTGNRLPLRTLQMRARTDDPSMEDALASLEHWEDHPS
jgi:hypothetical protein